MIPGYELGELEAAAAASRLEQSIYFHSALDDGLQRLRMHQARSLKLFNNAALSSHLLIVVGDPGAGKTTLLKQHKMRFDDDNTIDGRIMPVVLVEMPYPCTRKGLVEVILAAMDHEPSAHWNTARIVEEIANFARLHGVLMIAIDEADRIFGTEAPMVAKFLVSLLNTLDCQLVLAGAPEIQKLHKGWGLERRKEVDLVLKPYRFDTREGQLEFRALLSFFEETLQLPQPSNLASLAFSRRIYLASGGHVGIVSKLLVEALKRAHMTQRQSLNLELLGEVYVDFKKSEREQETIGYDTDAEELPPYAGLAAADNPFLCASEQLRSLWERLHSREKEPDRARKPATTGAKGRGKSS